MSTNFVFTAINKHHENCGVPPAITNDAKGHYYGYFENSLGEQWLFIYDFESDTGLLYGGDIGWDNPIKDNTGGYVLSSDELAWYAACWKAVSLQKELRAHRLD